MMPPLFSRSPLVALVDVGEQLLGVGNVMPLVVSSVSRSRPWSASPLLLAGRCESVPQGFVGNHGVGPGDHRHGRRSVAESPGHGLKWDACRCHPGTAGSA